MNCEKALILISAALDGELTEVERQLLEDHLNQCPQCRALSEDFGVLSVALSDMETQPPDGLIQQVEATLNTQGFSSPSTRAKRQRKALVSLVATVVAVFCLRSAYTFWQKDFAPSDSSASAPAPQDASHTQNHDSDSHFTQSITSSQQESSSERGEAVEHKNEETGSNHTAFDSIDPFNADLPQESLQSGNGAEKDSVTIESQQQTNAPADPPSANGTLHSPAPLPSAQSPGENTPIGGSTSSNEDAGTDQETGMTPLQALDLAFAHLGGWIQFPKAALDKDTPAYFLQRTEKENLTSDWWLKYEGLSSNGLYHIFRQYEYIVVNGANGWAHTSTINHFAISLDGLSVFSEYDADKTPENTSAYHKAIGD